MRSLWAASSKTCNGNDRLVGSSDEKKIKIKIFWDRVFFLQKKKKKIKKMLFSNCITSGEDEGVHIKQTKEGALEKTKQKWGN